MEWGQQVGGRYRLTAPLGRGAMGKVYRARDERLRRDVAVKVVDLTQTTDTSVADRFHREAIATAQLNHRNIVTIFDAGSDAREAWLVMELLSGQALSTIIRDSGPLPEARAIAIARPVASALVATHAIGVVHRDIKPANIMVDGDAVKLLDFGIALVQLDAEAHLTAPATTLGTAAYMSPEQAQGRRATAASDVYALGGVLVAMLTGHPPYGGDNPIQVAQRHVTEPAVSVRSRRPGISPALDDLVSRMLAKDPLARPTAAVVSQALAQLAEDPRSARTTILPAAVAAAGAAVVAPAATAVLPAATSALPAPTRAEAIPPRRVPPSRPPGDGFRTAALWLGVIIVAILVFMAAWAIGSQMFRGVAAATPASAVPGASAQPTRDAEPTTAPRRPTAPATEPPASRPPVALPSLPITLPTLPSGEEVALRTALAGVDAALAALPADSKAAKALTKAWESSRDDVADGIDPGAALDQMAEEIDKQREKGELNPLEAGAIRLALSAVRAAL
ncbi:serine/threonine-protein kinase [Propioniciclava sinopodophylli]|nr:serine/threonine-protein kinase [Propioniciclava sinopodophylli]